MNEFLLVQGSSMLLISVFSELSSLCMLKGNPMRKYCMTVCEPLEPRITVNLSSLNTYLGLVSDLRGGDT